MLLFYPSTQLAIGAESICLKKNPQISQFPQVCNGNFEEHTVWCCVMEFYIVAVQMVMKGLSP